MARKILLISYHFPPSTEVGGLRIANFARRLPRFGWTPYVLTVKDKYLQAVDPERLNDVRDVRIFKAGQTPTLSQAYLACKRATMRLLRKPDGRADIAYTNPPGRLKPGGEGEPLSMRLRRYVLSFLSLPDAQRNWLVPAVIEAVRAIRREKIECIMTSCPPYSAHLVGLLVKWTTGIRWWVADFRDPWMTTGAKSLSPTCSASLGIERWMERAVIRNADRVVTNTERLCEGLKNANGSSPKERFVCITNGFDREFFSGFTHLQKYGIFTITYAGSFYFGRTPEPVFRAIRDLVQEGAVTRHDIRVRLVGHCQSIEGRPTDGLIEHYGVRDVVEVLDPVSYNKAIEMIRQSHLALLLAPNQPYQIPAKIYDYMGAGTRVLAIAGAGATADLIRNTGIGGVFDPSDVAGIKGFISRSLAERGTPGCWIRPEAANPFDLDSISLRLADELNRVCVLEPGPEARSRVSSLHGR
jgi:glycosyltransferase involved in cell wall biosynthesis